MLTLDVLCEHEGWHGIDPDWTGTAHALVVASVAATPWAWLLDHPVAAELALELADDARVRTLNQGWRGQDKPTNVLSFPQIDNDAAGLLDHLSRPGAIPTTVLLGDIILAYETIAREARQQGKRMGDHAAHLIVHGTLHVLGYDHLTNSDADAMEALERGILAGFGIADPYEAAR